MKALFDKYKDIFFYLVFGVLTTVVNVAVYWVMAHVVGASTLVSTVVAWIFAVLFAYLTNRKWVFHSTAHGKVEITKEVVSFFACRLGTGVVDWLCMFVFVDLLCFNDVIVKLLSNFLVIFLNYVASKLLIFKSKQ